MIRVGLQSATRPMQVVRALVISDMHVGSVFGIWNKSYPIGDLHFGESGSESPLSVLDEPMHGSASLETNDPVAEW